MSTYSVVMLAPNQFNTLQYIGISDDASGRPKVRSPEDVRLFRTKRSAVYRRPYTILWGSMSYFDMQARSQHSFDMKVQMLRGVFEFASLNAFCKTTGHPQSTVMDNIDLELLPEYNGRHYLDLRTEAPAMIAVALEMAKVRCYLAPRAKGIVTGHRQYRENRDRRLHNAYRTVAYELKECKQNSEKRLASYLCQSKRLPVIKDRELIEEKLSSMHGITERYPFGYFSFVPLTHFTPPEGVTIRTANGCRGIALLDLRDPEMYRGLLRGTPVTPMCPACMRR